MKAYEQVYKQIFQIKSDKSKLLLKTHFWNFYVSHHSF